MSKKDQEPGIGIALAQLSIVILVLTLVYCGYELMTTPVEEQSKRTWER